ncbi:MAG TPA: geranylgeranyl reductase family protein [Bacteroidales bacterium]|nr:geranylgeranyl reductase family protein [Bacteroidales bacterium]HPS16744.1 geranylgeranyl reductase family protein [Bacteroidales bacterium]
MNSEKIFDVIIAGAGPAGSACALCLAESGLNVALLDKSTFPRKKICGDALSIDVSKQLPLISKILSEKFEALKEKSPSKGVRIIGPSGEQLEFETIHNNSIVYVVKRQVFDKLLNDCIHETPSIKYFNNCKVESVKQEPENITISTSSGIFKSKILVGADGANSVVSHFVTEHHKSKKHLCVGIRAYYGNVEGMHHDGHLELHFYKNILPCYLWIFPMQNKCANVGLGLMYSDILKSKQSLKKIMLDIIHEHPNVSPRFRNARLEDKIEAWPIPMAMDKKNISGERILLTGDAAGLIDPFTGEGVGNALRSGRIAAEHILKCFTENNFSSAFNKNYDKEIYRRMWNELRISKSTQKILKFPKLIDFIIHKANNNTSFRNLLRQALYSDEVKEKIIKNLVIKK